MPMNSVWIDPPGSDDVRRRHLFEGQLIVLSPTAASLALCDLAREMAEDAFAPLDPRSAQDELPVERFVEILADFKPRFIHHPRAKTLIRDFLEEAGCDIERVFFDVPRLRSMASGDYLRAGLAYPFHPHRDTWYSAPQCQLNWWLPVYEIEPENAMAFHPRYWSQPVRNSSRIYNYYEWNAKNRGAASQQIGKDTREQPRAEEEIEREPQIRILCPVGGAIVFAGAQLHSTVPNTSGYTRYNIDFRTVHLDDLRSGAGAPNLDSACTGTTLRDFMRASDLRPLPTDLVDHYDDGSADRGELVWTPRVEVDSSPLRER